MNVDPRHEYKIQEIDNVASIPHLTSFTQLLFNIEFETYVQQVQDERIFEAFVQLDVLILKYVLQKILLSLLLTLGRKEVSKHSHSLQVSILPISYFMLHIYSVNECIISSRTDGQKRTVAASAFLA